MRGPSTDETPRVLSLANDLGDCKDSAQVLQVATRRFADLFGPYAVYAVLLSDRDMEHWRLLALRNPYRTNEIQAGIPAEDLSGGTDIDALAQQRGDDVTAAVHASPALIAFFRDHEEAQFAAAGGFSGLGPSVSEAGGLLTQSPAFAGLECKSLLAASWRRPAGGRGCVILAYDHLIPDARRRLDLFALAVKLTTRLAFYPGFLNLIARLERISRSIRRNIVEDLTIPVTALKELAAALQQADKIEDSATRAELISALSHHVERLQEDLHDLIAPIDASWEPKKEPFDLALLVRQSVMAERYTDRAASHTIELTGDAEPLPIQADRRTVRRLVENLLSNAVKYSPGEDNTVTVSLTTRDNGSLAAISVQDEGVGMTPEQLKRLLRDNNRAFDPELSIEAAGFGLDSCQRILEAHGGRLEITSESGKGSTFTALLPVGG